MLMSHHAKRLMARRARAAVSVGATPANLCSGHAEIGIRRTSRAAAVHTAEERSSYGTYKNTAIFDALVGS